MNQPIVTRQSLTAMLLKADNAKKAEIIGRALCHLLDRQTVAEKMTKSTNTDNDIGFQKSDARSGTLTALSFRRSGTLQQWQIDKWMKPSGRSGAPRIAKYHRQLNEVAEAKRRG